MFGFPVMLQLNWVSGLSPQDVSHWGETSLFSCDFNSSYVRDVSCGGLWRPDQWAGMMNICGFEPCFVSWMGSEAGCDKTNVLMGWPLTSLTREPFLTHYSSLLLCDVASLYHILASLSLEVYNSPANYKDINLIQYFEAWHYCTWRLMLYND